MIIASHGGEDLTALNCDIGGTLILGHVWRPGEQGLEVSTMRKDAVWTVSFRFLVL